LAALILNEGLYIKTQKPSRLLFSLPLNSIIRTRSENWLRRFLMWGLYIKTHALAGIVFSSSANLQMGLRFALIKKTHPFRMGFDVARPRIELGTSGL
jgi:hypothetical protein